MIHSTISRLGHQAHKHDLINCGLYCVDDVKVETSQHDQYFLDEMGSVSNIITDIRSLPQIKTGRRNRNLLLCDLDVSSPARAKAKGQSLGRKPKLTPHQQREAIQRRDRGEALGDIARSYNVSPSTIFRLAA